MTPRRPKGRTVREPELAEIRAAVADYMGSEGCTCCQNIDAHAEHKERLAQLLNVKPYKDGSGYQFDLYRAGRRSKK